MAKQSSKGYVGLLVLAAALVLISVLSKTWFQEAGGNLAVGPTGFSAGYESGSLSKLNSGLAAAGTALLVTGLLTALTCLWAAAKPQIGRRAAVVSVLFIVVGMFFLGAMPGELADHDRTSMSVGFPLAVLAGVFGLAGGLMARAAASRDAAAAALEAAGS